MLRKSFGVLESEISCPPCTLTGSVAGTAVLPLSRKGGHGSIGGKTQETVCRARMHRSWCTVELISGDRGCYEQGRSHPARRCGLGCVAPEVSVYTTMNR